MGSVIRSQRRGCAEFGFEAGNIRLDHLRRDDFDGLRWRDAGTVEQVADRGQRNAVVLGVEGDVDDDTTPCSRRFPWSTVRDVPRYTSRTAACRSV